MKKCYLIVLIDIFPFQGSARFNNMYIIFETNLVQAGLKLTVLSSDPPASPSEMQGLQVVPPCQ